MPSNSKSKRGGSLKDVPESALEFQDDLQRPDWGNIEKNETLQSLLRTKKNRDLEPQDDEDDTLWGLLSFYTRDMRQANLNSTELRHCRAYIDYSASCLQEGYPNAFIKALSMAVTILETSQSKGGFLRRIMRYFRSEKHVSKEDNTGKGWLG